MTVTVSGVTLTRSLSIFLTKERFKFGVSLNSQKILANALVRDGVSCCIPPANTGKTKNKALKYGRTRGGGGCSSIPMAIMKLAQLHILITVLATQVSVANSVDSVLGGLKSSKRISKRIYT